MRCLAGSQSRNRRKLLEGSNGISFLFVCLKKIPNRHTFMGTLHEIKSRETSAQATKFAVLDGVGEGGRLSFVFLSVCCLKIDAAVMVINSMGVIQFMNLRLEKLLGYTKEILGRNVSFIMPEPYASSHDSYVRSYLKAGTPKVIGRGGRVVVAKHANGSVVPIHLEVCKV